MRRYFVRLVLLHAWLLFVLTHCDVVLPSRSDGDDIEFQPSLREFHPEELHHVKPDAYVTRLHVHRATVTHTRSMRNITLVSHATIDRLSHATRWCNTWRGPMSLSVFVRTMIDDADNVTRAFLSDDCLLRFAHMHIVRERDHVYIPGTEYGKDMVTHYPFNVQRNAAMEGCLGDVVFLVDIDFHFVYSDGSSDGVNHRLDESLGGEHHLTQSFYLQQDAVRRWTFLGDDAHWVSESAFYVVPAVETVTREMPLPRDLPSLVRMVQEHSACPFYGHHCKPCHHATQLRTFLTAREPYLIEYEERYEPYGIMNRSSRSRLGTFALPRYSAVFVGRGKDKLSYFYEIAAQRRPFIVLPFHFIVHSGRGDCPDAPSDEYKQREELNSRFYAAFARHVDAKYRSLVSAEEDSSIFDEEL